MKLKERIEAYIKAYQKLPHGHEVEGTVELLEECKNAIRMCTAHRWIPVAERLPENAKHKGAFCPRYQVMTKYGVTEGWYNPGVESWYVLIWFITERVLTSEIDLKTGTYPKIVRVPIDTKIVTAWMPLPEPYKPEKGV